jgi:hypothetical protein
MVTLKTRGKSTPSITRKVKTALNAARKLRDRLRELDIATCKHKWCEIAGPGGGSETACRKCGVTKDYVEGGF